MFVYVRLSGRKAEVSGWEEEAHRRLEEADEKQRAADRCTRDGANARRELERLKKAVESNFEDLQRQARYVVDVFDVEIASVVVKLRGPALRQARHVVDVETTSVVENVRGPV